MEKVDIAITISASIGCTELLGNDDIDILEEFGKLTDGDVTYYTDVTVERTFATTDLNIIAREIDRLRLDMLRTKQRLLKKVQKKG